MGSIAIKCSNCDIRTSLLLRVKTVKEMVTKFLFNTKLYHVGLSWIISSSKQIKYDIKDNNSLDWLNKGPRYNTAICSKLHGTVFDDFIINDRTYRCNIICSIPAHDKNQPTYVDDSGIGGGRSISKNKTTAALESLGATLNFIHYWRKIFHNNNEVRLKNGS